MEDRHRCLQAGNGDKRTGFLQCSGIAISPLPSLRLPLFPRTSSLSGCRGSTAVPRIWSTRYPLTNRANVSARARAPFTCTRTYTSIACARKCIYIYVYTYIYMYIYIYIRVCSLDGSLPRTRQVHLHSRGVLVAQRERRLKRDTLVRR